MGDLIAVKQVLGMTIEHIKRDILLFDHLIISEDGLNLNNIVLLPILQKVNLLTKEEVYNFRNELDYLMGSDLIKCVNLSDDLINEQNLNKILSQMNENETKEFEGLVNKRLNIKVDSLKGRAFDFKSLINMLRDHEQLTNRILTTSLALTDEMKHYTNNLPYLSKNTEHYTRRADTLNLILKKFPIPADTVSWEEIIEFKSNDDAKRELLRLRAWISKITHSKYTINEIEQEIEYLLMEYENRMKLQKMKYSYSNVEVVLMTSLEVIENTVKFNWSKIGKSLFDLKKRNIDLLISETKAPGKELAYLSKLNSKFQKP